MAYFVFGKSITKFDRIFRDIIRHCVDNFIQSDSLKIVIFKFLTENNTTFVDEIKKGKQKKKEEQN